MSRFILAVKQRSSRRSVMKNYKTISTIYYLCAVVFYLVALIIMLSSDQNGMGITWMCLASVWLSLGSVYRRKAQNDDSSKEDK